MQLWCQKYQDEVYILPNLEDLKFYQPQVKNALRILNISIPLYGVLIDQENQNSWVRKTKQWKRSITKRKRL